MSHEDQLRIIEYGTSNAKRRILNPSERQEFSHSLHHFKPLFKSLLVRPPPKAEDRAKVQMRKVQLPDGTIATLDGIDVTVAIKLSDDFNLNEIECVNLIFAAHRKLLLSGRGANEYYQLSAGNFFEDRLSVLDSLLAILKFVATETIVDTGIGKEVAGYLEDLLGGGLRARILLLIRELNREDANGLGGPSAEPSLMDYKKIVVLRREAVQTERLKLAHCLLLSCTVARINATEAKEIFSMLRDSVREWDAAPNNSGVFRILYRLLFSLVLSFLLEFSTGGSTPLLLSRDPSFRKEFHQMVTNVPSSAEAHGVVAVVRMVFGILLAVTGPLVASGSSSAEDQAILACWEPESLLNCFHFLVHDFLGSPVFKSDDGVEDTIPSLLSILLRHMLTNPRCRACIMELRNASVNESMGSSEGQISSQPGVSKAKALLTKKAEAFLALLEFVGWVYRRNQNLMTNFQELWNFVNYVGEELQSYKTVIAYLNLLTDLASDEDGARQVFTYLMEGRSPVVSWSDFSRRLQSLAQEVNNAIQQVDWRLLPTGTPASQLQEPVEQLLTAYLRCLKKVAESGSINEQQTWLTIDIQQLFWLLPFPMIPPSLKGALREAISAFVDVSQAYRITVWNSLANFDGRPTQRGDPQGIPKDYDISKELSEVESCLETYPSTLSYIVLRNRLLEYVANGEQMSQDQIDHLIMDTFQFVKDDVFAQYNQRKYKEPSQKWQLAAASLRYFNTISRLYDSAVESASETPLHEIMRDLTQGGIIYQNMMAIVRLGPQVLLDARYSCPFVDWMEEAVSLCLDILLKAFGKDLPLAEKWPTSYQPLHVLLEYDTRLMVILLSYVQYEDGPEIVMSAIKIMSILSDREANLVGAILEKRSAEFLKRSYALLLKRSLDTVSDHTSEDDDVGHLILQLLLDSLEKPSPNVALLLLGFNVEGSVDRSVLHRNDLNCFQAIMTSIRATERSHDELLHEMCLHLLHDLCADLLTSGPTMDYFQSIHFDFLVKRFDNVAEPLPPQRTQSLWAILLRKRGWVLKILALSFHLAEPADQGQYRVYQTLLEKLFTESQLKSHSMVGSFQEFGNGLSTNGDEMGVAQKAKALEVLDLLPTNVPFPVRARSAQTEAYLSELRFQECLEKAAIQGEPPSGSRRRDRMVDITILEKELHQEYLQVVNSRNISGNLDQRKGLVDAASEGMAWAKQYNLLLEERSALLHLAVAWARLMQIAIIKRYDLLDLDTPSAPLVTVMKATLSAVASSEISLDMAIPLSQVALATMVKLQALSIVRTDERAGDISGDVTFLDLQVKNRISATDCVAVLSGLVAAILRHDSSETLRRRLYATLLTYLRYCRGSTTPTLPVSVMMALVSDGALADDGAEMEKTRHEQAVLSRMNFDALRAEAVALVDVLARDASHGVEHGRSLVYKTLTELISIEQENNSAEFLSQLQRRALLQSCLLAIASMPQHVVTMPGPEYMRQLYTHEAQLGLLLKVASQKSTHGVKLLSAMGALRSVGECRALSLPVQDDPESFGSSKHVYGTLIVPPQRERQHQIVAPSLSLVWSITPLASREIEVSKRENNAVAVEVSGFLDVHHSLFERILTNKEPKLLDLKELTLATGILRREWPSRDSEAHRGRREARQDALYQLAIDFFSPLSESPLKLVKQLGAIERQADVSPEQREKVREMDARLLLIRRNLAEYLQNVVVQHGVLFHAQQQVAATTVNEAGRYRPSGKGPTLTILAKFLKEASTEFLTSIEDKTILLSKMRDVNEFSRHEVEELIKLYGSGTEPTSGDSMRSRRLIAMQEMVRAAAAKETQLSTLLYIIENFLEILYIHFQRHQSESKQSPGSVPSSSGLPGRGLRGDSSSQAVVPFEMNERVGESDDLESVAKLVIPCFHDLEKASEQKAGHSLQALRRLLHLLRRTFLDKYASLY